MASDDHLPKILVLHEFEKEAKLIFDEVMQRKTVASHVNEDLLVEMKPTIGKQQRSESFGKQF